MSFSSETMRLVTPALDFAEGGYTDCELVRESPRGRIYRAERAGKRLILKAAATDGGQDIERLKREYELSVNLSHPSLAYVFTYEKDSPVGACIVMEYVDGRSLEEYLAEGPSLSGRRKVFLQILDAVEYFHRHDVIHNDLSPSNILVSRADDAVKIIDFGFADDDAHYLAKGLGGTRAYASPELLSGGEIDSRSDIWTLGLLMRDIFGGRYGPVIRKCLRPDPERRYRSVDALRKAYLHFFRPLWLIAATLAAVAAVIFAAGLSGRMAEYREQAAQYERMVEQNRIREEMLAGPKARLDEYYAVQIAEGRRRIEAASSPSEKYAILLPLIDQYNIFWKELVDDCPPEVAPELLNYIAAKYSLEFPVVEFEPDVSD